MESNAPKRDGCGQIESDKKKQKQKVPYPHSKVWPKVVTKYIPLLEHHLYGPMCGRKMKKKKSYHIIQCITKLV
jgi:hypothetical protein